MAIRPTIRHHRRNRIAVTAFAAMIALPALAGTSPSIGDRLGAAAPDRTVTAPRAAPIPTDRETGSAAIVFQIGDADAGFAHALVVDLPPGEGENPELIVNGRKLTGDPIPSYWGPWYVVPAGVLVAGENRVELVGAGGREIALFPLLDEVEIDHFGTLVRFIAADAEPPVDPRQLQMDVLHCDLSIRVDPDRTEIPDGELLLTASATEDGLAECVLDLDDNNGAMQVLAADGGPGTDPFPFAQDGDSERVIIDLPAPLTAGETFQVRIRYAGVPRIGYHATTHARAPLVYTYSQPYAGRGWWPCKDIPSDKFTADIRVTVPDLEFDGYPLTPISNGELVEVTDHGDGIRTFHWHEGYPIVSYLVSVTCSNYRPAEGTYTALDGVTTMPVTHYLYPEKYNRAAKELPNTISVIEFFAETFGEYPFLAEKYCTAGWNLDTAMEHQTCTSIPDNDLALAFHRRNVHELGHMWFGDLITYRSYTHLWIAEGWARYCEALMDEKRLGPAGYHARIDGWAVSDTRPLVSPDQYRFDTMTFRTAYNKGGWVLHMLRHQLGDDVFFAGTRAFVANPELRYGIADTDDLATAFESAAGEDLTWFFEQWAMRASIPRYHWRWRHRTADGRSLIDVFLLQTQTGEPYLVPIEFDIERTDGTHETVTLTNTEKLQGYVLDIGDTSVEPAQVLFDPENWLLDVHTRIQTSVTPADAPLLRSVVAGAGIGEARIAWEPSNRLSFDGYRLYESGNGYTGWTRIRDEVDLPVTEVETVRTGIPAGESRYYRLTRVNNGEEGPPSDVYGVRPGAPACLLVDAYDAWELETGSRTGHPVSAAYGQAIAASGRPFATCADEAFVADAPGAVVPQDYAAVVWAGGTDAAGFEVVTPEQQAALTAWIGSGGRLLIAADELARDLGRPGISSDADVAFLHEVLHCAFVHDLADADLVVGGEGSSAFAGETFAIHDLAPDGGHRTLDVVRPINANRALLYTGDGAAAVQFVGAAEPGQPVGAVIALGFDLAAMRTQHDRDRLIALALDWLANPLPPATDSLLLR